MPVELTREISDHQMQWRNDKRINDWTRQNGIRSVYEMALWKTAIEDDPSVMMFGIIARDPKEGKHVRIPRHNENIGTCGLTSIDRTHRKAEFSLLINPMFHRQGWGKQALHALLRYGFNHLNLHCIWGETFEGNPALHLFEAVGMHREGTCRDRYFKNGKYVDCHLISMLEDDFKGATWT